MTYKQIQKNDRAAELTRRTVSMGDNTIHFIVWHCPQKDNKVIKCM